MAFLGFQGGKILPIPWLTLAMIGHIRLANQWALSQLACRLSWLLFGLLAFEALLLARIIQRISCSPVS